MDDYVLLSVQLICTLEGTTGVVLNVVLLILLLQRPKHIFSNTNIYRIPILISSIQGGMLSFAIAAMNYVHIFRDGTFIVAMLGPLVLFVPMSICNIGVEICFVLTTMKWTMIPSTRLHYRSKASHWSPKERIVISFSFTIICIIFLGALTPDFIPTPSFYEFIEQITRDLYKVNPSQDIVVVGSTVTTGIECMMDGRSMLRILIFFVIIPYAASYTYFIFMIRKRLKNYGVAVSERTNKMQKALFQMQMLQGFLPLAFISIPFVVFIVGAILHANLDFATLVFTITVWFCPIIQVSLASWIFSNGSDDGFETRQFDGQRFESQMITERNLN